MKNTLLDKLSKLYDKIYFQERRNFFNNIEDIHINQLLKVIDASIQKINNKAFGVQESKELTQILFTISENVDLYPDTLEYIKITKERLNNS